MAQSVPAYRSSARTTLALNNERSRRHSGNPQAAILQAADEVGEGVDEPLLNPEDSPPFVIPLDRYGLVKNAFFLFGVVVLLPWNFIATASDFWMYKFRNVTAGDSFSPLERTHLQTTFFGAFAVASTLPSLLAVYLGTQFSHRIRQEVRNILGLCLCIFLLAIVTAFVKISTDSWQYGFFVLTIVLIVLLNGVVSWLQGAITGLAAMLPQGYMHYYVIGMAVAGVLASVVQIITLMGHTDPTTSALAYFLCALGLVAAALVCFIAVQSSEFFKHSVKHPQGNIQGLISYEDLEVNVSPLVILRKMWMQGASAGLTFLVTGAVFPAVTVLVVSENVQSGSAWTGRFFTPVCNYLLFNLSDMSGRMACLFSPVSEKWEKHLLVLSAWRLVPMVLLMLCNAQPRVYLPVVFSDDLSFVVLIVVFGLSNGYLLSAAMMQVPMKVETYLQEKAGFVMCMCAVVGLTIGSFITLFIVKLL